MEGYNRNKYYLSNLLRNQTPLFVFLQEHWLPHHNARKRLSEDFKDYIFLTTSSDIFTPIENRILESGPTWHGAAIGWHKTIDSKVTKIPVLHERFCGVTYSENHVNVLAYSAYLPTTGNDDEYLDVLELLTHDIQAHCKGSIIIGLDSNQSIKSTRRRTNAMDKFLNTFSLKTLMISDTPTFHHNNQSSESLIDHILHNTNEKSDIIVEFKEHICKLDVTENLSSHDVIVGKIKVPVERNEHKEIDFSHTYTDFTVKKPIWNSEGIVYYQKQCADTLAYLVNNFNQSECIPILSELTSKMFVLSAENSFETFTSNPSNRKEHKLPHFSLEHRQAYMEHKKICSEWRKQGRPIDKLHPARIAKLQSQRKLQYIARKESSTKCYELNTKLMQSFSDDINNVYKILNKAKGKVINRDISHLETLNGTFTGENIL